MLILTNSLSDTPDEGALNAATSLVSRIRKQDPAVKIVTYDRYSSLSDQHLKLNKLLLSEKLLRILRHKDTLLYIPFPTRSLPMAVRTFLLSRICRGKLCVLVTMTRPVGPAARYLLHRSGAEFAVLSRDAWTAFRKFLPENRVIRVKTGVDAEKFTPVTADKARELKVKYGFDPDRPVVLHVGHLKAGRNVAALTKIPKECQVLLVVSTHTTQEEAIRRELLEGGNVRILDTYVAEIQEIYQLSDVYFFPVEQPENCIDVPLSCLEAAACGKSVVTTAYGEIKEFSGKPGFIFLKSSEEMEIERGISAALNSEPGLTRTAAEEYDWNNAAKMLTEWGRRL